MVKKEFRNALAEATEESTELAKINGPFETALDQYVRACGGDPARASDEEQQSLGAAMADWLANILEKL